MKQTYFLIFISLGTMLFGAGTLKTIQSTDMPIQIIDHHVDVVINNGFSRTTVTQTFHNPNPHDLEAIYQVPLPKHASLAEMSMQAGEIHLQGEVIAKDEANTIYQEEKAKGNNAGKAEKKGFLYFDFQVSPVPANSDVMMQYVYYQPVEIDTNVGRYLYPLEEGGTDEAAEAFWSRNDKVESSFSISLELKSSWPVTSLRMPGFQNLATIDQHDEGHYRVDIPDAGTGLDRDFVFYYQLEENLPGSVELLAYKQDKNHEGTFMLVITPGLDLQPVTSGDYCFILDLSGSMSDKISTLADGVSRAIGGLNPEDRFRVITFSNEARELIPWTQASGPAVEKAIQAIKSMQVHGGTNLYSGLEYGFRDLDADRTTSIILVTDAVTNTGIVDPKDFYKLLQKYDVRIFGFLLGNSGNWPLMRLICDTTGGFYTGISNADDVLGQVMLAKSKLTSTCLHDTELKVRGVKVGDTTDKVVGKLYRGQQLLLLGKYKHGGKAEVQLTARMSGEDKVYKTRFHFPDEATEYPELERIWALNRIEAIEDRANKGLLPETESEQMIQNLGIDYQIVTDYTSMIVLEDQVYEERGIQRRNQTRIQRERNAQQLRKHQAPSSQRIDREQPMFDKPRPSLGSNGGGAIDPYTALTILMVLMGISILSWKKQ